MHKGKAFATSDGPGKGSEFTVEFPLTAERPDPLPFSITEAVLGTDEKSTLGTAA